MRKKVVCLCLFIAVLSQIGTATAAVSYATERLHSIIEQLPGVSPASFQAGKSYFFNYQNRSVVVRVNNWNEVEHVGYRMFGEELRADTYTPVLDFIERYLLELTMLPSGSVTQRLQTDDVVLENGMPEDFVSMGAAAAVSIQYSDFKYYHVEWKGGGRTLSMTFPMDYQLISGCNAIEVEKNYIRDVTRYRPQARTGWVTPEVPEGYDKEYFLEERGSYLSESVRHDLYYRKNGGKWELFCDPKKPEWSVYNLMLSPVPVGGHESAWTLDVELDQYGYQSTAMEIPLNRWIAFCEENDGMPYFTIKEMSESVIKGVLFVPNERGGYCHMLSVEIPMKTIEKGEGRITGRLYVYVPLHNIEKDYFKIK